MTIHTYPSTSETIVSQKSRKKERKKYEIENNYECYVNEKEKAWKSIIRFPLEATLKICLLQVRSTVFSHVSPEEK